MNENEGSGHSVLSPSSSERWLSCPASVRMAREVAQPPGTSIYASEGTAAHALGELKARHQLLGALSLAEFKQSESAWSAQHGWAVSGLPDMQRHTQAYVDFLKSRLAIHPNSQLMLEQRVPTGVPSCWGTSDAVIVSPVHVEIVDLKYGMGVQVEAEGNPQLRLYGVGALEAFGFVLGETKYVRTTVFQPRLHHTVSEELSAAELVAWRDSIIPIAELALGHDAPFGPSDAACRWCPASGQCAAQLEYATAMDFGVIPETLSEEDLADALDRIPAIEAWCAAVRDLALDWAYSKGRPIPRYKVVASSGRRVVTDPDAALEALTAIGYALDEVSKRKINGIGELEKLLQGDFDLAVGPFVTKTKGNPSLVPESDKRKSIDPEEEARKEFSSES